MSDIEIQVAADADVPAHASDAAHNFATGSDLFIGFVIGGFGPAENLAFAARFRDVPIPRQARIRSAVVRLEAATSLSEVTVNARTDGLALGNSETPTHAEFDGGAVGAIGHGRASVNRTTAQVLWTNIPATTAGSDFDTPDISLVIQEIISRSDWDPGNALTLFIGDEDHESDQVFNHYRDALRSGPAPRLLVTFSVSPDPAIFEVKLGELPQTLPRRAAETLQRGDQALVE